MTLSSITDGAELAKALLAVPSERDAQKSIGASSFGSACDFCVANDLIGTDEVNEYALATSIGTGVHGHLETLAAQHLPGAVIEQKISLGVLDGYEYGPIGSKPDLVRLDPHPDHVGRWQCLDWKTTQKVKLKEYVKAYNTEPAKHEFPTLTAARFTMHKYLGQLMSYGRGLVLAGYDVERMSMVFIPRDGKKLQDIVSFDFIYDQEYADSIWARLEALWDFIKNDGDVTQLTSAPGCFPCERSGRV